MVRGTVWSGAVRCGAVGRCSTVHVKRRAAPLPGRPLRLTDRLPCQLLADAWLLVLHDLAAAGMAAARAWLAAQRRRRNQRGGTAALAPTRTRARDIVCTLSRIALAGMGTSGENKLARQIQRSARGAVLSSNCQLAGLLGGAGRGARRPRQGRDQVISGAGRRHGGGVRWLHLRLVRDSLAPCA